MSHFARNPSTLFPKGSITSERRWGGGGGGTCVLQRFSLDKAMNKTRLVTMRYIFDRRSLSVPWPIDHNFKGRRAAPSSQGHRPRKVSIYQPNNVSGTS